MCLIRNYVGNYILIKSVPLHKYLFHFAFGSEEVGYSHSALRCLLCSARVHLRKNLTLRYQVNCKANELENDFWRRAFLRTTDAFADDPSDFLSKLAFLMKSLQSPLPVHWNAESQKLPKNFANVTTDVLDYVFITFLSECGLY